MDEAHVAMFMPGLAPDSLGWHVHLDFARCVEAEGLSFEMLTTGSPASGSGNFGPVKCLDVSRVWSIVAEPVAPLLRTRSLLPAAAALTRHLRTEGHRIDLLHVEVAYPHGAAVALARRWAGWSGPLVVTPMGEDTLVDEEVSYGFRRYLVPRLLVSWTLCQADLIRCISPLHERWIAEIAPTRPRVVIPLNVSAAVERASREPERDLRRRREDARRRLDDHCQTAGRPVVLALGRLHPFKGIDVLVRAMALVPDAMLVIVGPSLSIRPHGDVAEGLMRLAETLGIRHRVTWVGAVPPESSLEWLAAADVVAVPSHLESLNKVCIEAAAVGTPFIVTETTGISAWVSDRERVGRVVPPRDPAALASALTEMTTGRWRPDPTALAAFAQRFHPRAVAGALVEAYRDVLTRRGVTKT